MESLAYTASDKVEQTTPLLYNTAGYVALRGKS